MLERCRMSRQCHLFSRVQTPTRVFVRDQSHSQMAASRSVGVGEMEPLRWVRQLQMERQGVRPPSTTITPDHWLNTKQLSRRGLSTL